MNNPPVDHKREINQKLTEFEFSLVSQCVLGVENTGRGLPYDTFDLNETYHPRMERTEWTSSPRIIKTNYCPHIRISRTIDLRQNSLSPRCFNLKSFNLTLDLTLIAEITNPFISFPNLMELRILCQRHKILKCSRNTPF